MKKSWGSSRVRSFICSIGASRIFRARGPLGLIVLGVAFLGLLAHNVLVWAKGWLLPLAPRLAKYGVKRLVRDVLGIMGRVEWDEQRRVRGIVLTSAHPLAPLLLAGFEQLVAAMGVAVVLGHP